MVLPPEEAGKTGFTAVAAYQVVGRPIHAPLLHEQRTTPTPFRTRNGVTTSVAVLFHHRKENS